MRLPDPLDVHLGIVLLRNGSGVGSVGKATLRYPPTDGYAEYGLGALISGQPAALSRHPERPGRVQVEITDRCDSSLVITIGTGPPSSEGDACRTPVTGRLESGDVQAVGVSTTADRMAEGPRVLVTWPDS